MTYNEDLYIENVEEALHPKNSPLPPAEYAKVLERGKEEADLNERLAEDRRRAEDTYRADIPLAEEFVA